MQKSKFIFIALLIGLLMIVIAVTYFYLNHQEFLAQRHHLLCEILKPGMSKDEVLKILKDAGDFTVSGAESQSPNAEWYVVFTDPNGRDIYGAFNLGFSDNKYESAYIRGMDYWNIICDFSKVTQFPTEIIKP